MPNNIREKILVPIIIAVILAILATVWKGITDGTLITFLGGVSKQDLKNHQHDPLGLEGAVIAFDLAEGCPEGWSNFIEAESRTIIGAAFGGSSNSGLTQRPYREGDKGKEDITLTTANIPKHEHQFYDIYYSEHPDYPTKNQMKTFRVPDHIGSNATDRDNTGWTILHNTEPFGENPATKFTNMPPYIALFYCKRV